MAIEDNIPMNLASIGFNISQFACAVSKELRCGFVWYSKTKQSNTPNLHAVPAKDRWVIEQSLRSVANYNLHTNKLILSRKRGNPYTTQVWHLV